MHSFLVVRGTQFLNVVESKTMSRHFDTRNIDRAAIEREARRMQAEALASGFRSVRNWTVGMFQRRPAGQTI